MKISLTAFGYWHDSHAKVWTRPYFEGIAYSDAERVEERISKIVDQARDLSLFSADLARNINDWPTRYHLSASRSNILRPFQEQLAGADVLEIGAGCGAITRYLGESGASVVALEGGARRASIARARTRDLPNVEVVADHFNDFNPEKRFDFITLIGVLEYAGTFVTGEQPALRMIERARQLLKPDGRLIIAIENQLGIKYFAGVAEDHIGQSVYGLEGRYQDHEPKTYGRKELVDTITDAGFAGAEVLAPFPDYKFPVSIITESGFANGDFDSAALASEWVGHDPDLTSQLTFSPALTWPVVEKNGMALDLANSFLVVAKQSAGKVIDSSVLAYHYPAHRSKEYCKEVTYLATEDRSIELRVTVVETDSKPRTPGKYRRFSLSDRSDYVRGTPLSLELTNIIIRDGWKIEEVGAFIKRYLGIASSLAGKANKNIHLDNIASPLSGRYFDLIPRNIIIGTDGEIHAIDQEWDFAGDISAGVLVFRALIQLLYAKFRFGKTVSEFQHTRMGFMIAAFKAAGFEVSEAAILSYAKLETAAQSDVAQRPLTVGEVFAPNSPIHFKAMVEAYTDTRDRARLSEKALALKATELSKSKEQLRRLECAEDGKWSRLWRRLTHGGVREVRVS